MNTWILAVGSVFFIAPTLVFSASFDCTKASTRVEQLVCSNQDLSALDTTLADTYAKYLKAFKDPDIPRNLQRRWLLDVRDRCTDARCLQQIYERRIKQLTINRDSLFIVELLNSCGNDGTQLPMGYCLGGQTFAELLHVDNLIDVLTLSKKFTESQEAKFRKSQDEWRKHLERYCLGKADNYQTGKAVVVYSCQLPMVKARASEIKEMFNAVSAPAAADSVTGTWSWTGKAQSGGRLKTIQEGESVRFQLELSRGAPSYNSGFIEGEFQLHGNVGVFTTTKYGDCQITFTFGPKKVVLGEEAKPFACGFGNAVHADGEYPLVSRDRPTFSHGDPRTQ